MTLAIWRPVVTHPLRYEVSRNGDVRALAWYHPMLKRQLPPLLLAQGVGGRAKNYARVMLANPKRHAYVHHLMAEAFLGDRPEGLMILHRDDNGFNNRIDNLRYGDREENEMDRHVARVAPHLEKAPF